MSKIDAMYASCYGWGMDFWRAFLLRPKIIRWLVKKLMGRYAWNELVGLKEAIEKEDGKEIFAPCIGYDLQNQEYHKELDQYKDW